MLKLNSELRAEARASLKGKWFIAAVTVLIYVAIVFTFSFIPFLSAPLSLFVGTVLGYGLVVAFLDSFRGKELEIGDLFEGFKNYGKVLGTTLLTTLYIFLWMLLLIIPGI
ncbi:MAG: DUF975 family protein, partial [Dysgonamonadaceae bacterium]|nr:DUF975 family protein [Dysgonamonadaceae bacterium]